MRNLTDFGFQCLQMGVIGLCGIGMALAQTPNSAPHPAKVVKKKEPSKSMPMAPEPELAPHEISIAERVHVGTLPCEMGASVRMTADANAPGYFTLQGKGYKYRMRPVATSSGAIRLEDEKAGAVWLQLANKSNKNASSPCGGDLISSINSAVCFASKGKGGIPNAARSAACSR